MTNAWASAAKRSPGLLFPWTYLPSPHTYSPVT